MDHANAVKAVAALFKSRGYSVIVGGAPTANGPDLTVIGKKQALRVEVKVPRFNRGNYWNVRPIEASRRADDLVALVFPSGFIHVEEMTSYLKIVADDGSRGLTLLGRIWAGTL